MGTETCPSCNNEGSHLAVLCGPNGCRETMRACDFCGGLGIVEAAAATSTQTPSDPGGVGAYPRHQPDAAQRHRVRPG
jgi:hypothetical protein